MRAFLGSTFYELHTRHRFSTVSELQITGPLLSFLPHGKGNSRAKTGSNSPDSCHHYTPTYQNRGLTLRGIFQISKPGLTSIRARLLRGAELRPGSFSVSADEVPASAAAVLWAALSQSARLRVHQPPQQRF